MTAIIISNIFKMIVVVTACLSLYLYSAGFIPRLQLPALPQ